MASDFARSTAATGRRLDYDTTARDATARAAEQPTRRPVVMLPRSASGATARDRLERSASRMKMSAHRPTGISIAACGDRHRQTPARIAPRRNTWSSWARAWPTDAVVEDFGYSSVMQTVQDPHARPPSTSSITSRRRVRSDHSTASTASLLGRPASSSRPPIARGAHDAGRARLSHGKKGTGSPSRHDRFGRRLLRCAHLEAAISSLTRRACRGDRGLGAHSIRSLAPSISAGRRASNGSAVVATAPLD